MEDTREKILIVDDNPENIKILANILNRQNYKLAFAKNGKETLRILEKNSYDLILLDVMMPDMDGCEVCIKIKENIKTKNIPIIFVTAKDQIEDEKKGLDIGAVDYITKPIEPTITLARVKTHLELNKLRKNLEIKVQEEIDKRMVQQKLLVRQSRLAAMGEMLNAITHQWKQPLGIAMLINSNFQLELSDENIDKNRLKSYSNKLQDTINFLSHTIDDFKNYFSPNKEKENFDIKNEIEDILNMLQAQIKNEAIKLDTSIEQNLEIYGVASEFKHVILNLISNAKDAFNQNKIRERNISINGWLENENIKISVQDNAGGIDETIVDKIFDDYFTTKENKGTGIGLSMSKLIIEDELKGRIEVQNKNGGALFTITIPLYKSN